MNNIKTIFFDEYEVEIHFKKVKYFRIKIKDASKIIVSSPKNFSLEKIQKNLNNDIEWIKKHTKKIKNKKFNKNEVIFLGKKYTLIINENFKNIEILNAYITTSSIKNFDEYKKNYAKIEFKKLIDFYSPFIKKDINKVSIKKMTTRWGSCNSRKGYINLNLNLLEKDIKFIEYVVLHELTHLIYPNHQPTFYNFIKAIMPDYKERMKL